jgi:hypothetical protein
MQDEAADGATSSSDDFWVLAAALKRFVENEGCGSLPLEASQLWRSLKAACLPHALTAIRCPSTCVEISACAILILTMCWVLQIAGKHSRHDSHNNSVSRAAARVQGAGRRGCGSGGGARRPHPGSAGPQPHRNPSRSRAQLLQERTQHQVGPPCCEAC